MPTPLTKPVSIVEPFAINGQKNTIPVTTSIPGAASLDQGFPALTMTPVQQGGVPPSGKDFNGIFNWVTQHLAWVNAGGGYTFDATVAAFIGGYPIGMVLQSNDGQSSYINVAAGNSADFNTDPTQIGVTWMPYGGAAVAPNAVTTVTTTGGSTVLTGAQATRRVIKVTGALTSNANIIVPNNLLQQWTVINATTGAFTLNVAPSGGTSVSVAQGAANVIVSNGAAASYAQTDAPTQPANDNSTKISTTAHALAAIAAALVNTSLTGTPTATTPPTGDNSTRISTTAFVMAVIAAALVDTTLTGNPTAPTRSVNDNSTHIATTAYADRSAANIAAGGFPQYKTANFTAGPTGDYWTDTTGGAFTMTLPDPPGASANPIRVQDIGGMWGVYPLTVDPGTKTILGAAGPLVCDVGGEMIELWYNGSDWRIV